MNQAIKREECTVNALPQVLIPFDAREAIDLKTAAWVAGKLSATIRDWAARLDLGRRAGGGVWLISLPTLQMRLGANKAALAAHLRGTRESPGMVGISSALEFLCRSEGVRR